MLSRRNFWVQWPKILTKTLFKWCLGISLFSAPNASPSPERLSEFAVRGFCFCPSVFMKHYHANEYHAYLEVAMVRARVIRRNVAAHTPCYFLSLRLSDDLAPNKALDPVPPNDELLELLIPSDSPNATNQNSEALRSHCDMVSPEPESRMRWIGVRNRRIPAFLCQVLSDDFPSSERDESVIRNR